jgi:RNA polymerase sigma-B factor
MTESSDRETLIWKHLALADALARRFVSEIEPFEDLRQVALIGLLKACDRFDPARGVPFEAFAVPTILGELRNHVRDRAWPVRVPRRVRRLELEQRRPPRVAVPFPEDDLAAPDELAESEDRLLVAALLARLGGRERAIVERYYLAGWSQTEIARELSLSQIHVSRLLRSALAVMRDQLDGAAA